MITGDAVVKIIYLQTLGGRNLSYADKASFQAAGWGLTWRDSSGVALTAQPTWTIADEGSSRHRVRFIVPSGVAWVEPTVPSTYADPGTWTTEGLAYDEATLAALLQTSQGVPALGSAADGDLGDVVMGDSWDSGTLTVPLGKLTPFGYTTISGMTISAALKQDPSSTGVVISASIVSGSGNTVKANWTTFPSGLNLGSTASDTEALWYVDLQLKNTGASFVLTPLRYQLRVKWQRDVS